MMLKKRITTALLGACLTAGAASSAFGSGLTFTEIPVENRTGGGEEWMQVSDNGEVIYFRDGKGYTWSFGSGETLVHQGDDTLFVDISNDGQVTRFGSSVYINGESQNQIPEFHNVHTLSPAGDLVGVVDIYTNYPGVTNLSTGVTQYYDDAIFHRYKVADISNQGVKLLSPGINYFNPSPFFLVDAQGAAQEVNFRYGSVSDLSGDGKSIIGRSYFCQEFGGSCAAITKNSETIEIADANFFPRGLNSDGSIVVGDYRFYSGNDFGGLIWDRTNGLRDIVDVLAQSGIDISGWSQIRLYDISDNGYYIIGEGKNPDGVRHPFLINATPECQTSLY